MLLCIRSVDIEIFGLHELIVYEFEDHFSVLLCIHTENMEIFVLHQMHRCLKNISTLMAMGRHDTYESHTY